MASTVLAQLRFNTQVPPYNKGEVAAWPYLIDDTGKLQRDLDGNKIHSPIAKTFLTKRMNGIPIAEYVKDVEVDDKNLALEMAGVSSVKADEVNQASNPQSKQNRR